MDGWRITLRRPSCRGDRTGNVTVLSVSDFVGVETALDPCFTESGGIAYRSNRGGAPQVFIVDAVGDEPRQVTYTGGVVYAIDPRPGHNQLLLVTDDGGDEQYQLRLLDLDTLEIRDLASEPQVIYNRGAWSSDGRLLSYASNRRDVAHFDVHVLNLDTGVEHCVWQLDAMLGAGRFSADASMLIVDQPNLEHQGDGDLFAVQLHDDGSAEGEPVLLTEHLAGVGGSAQWSDAVVHRSGVVLALSDEEREFTMLQRIEANGSRREVVLEREWDIESFAVAPGDSRLAVVVNEDGYSRLAAFDLDHTGQAGAPVDVAEVPSGVVDSLRWTASGDALMFSFVGAQNPSHIWTAAVGHGAASTTAVQITPGETGLVDPSVLPEPELVRYPTFDGRQIPGFLYTPRQRVDPSPCLVIVHGGPEAQSRPPMWAQSAALLLLTEGVSVFVPNVRGSTGYGKEYSHADDVEKRMDSVRDLVACTDWLVGAAGIDPDRIGVVGQSYGGFMVLAAITEAPDLWAMAVDLYGIANFETFMEFTGAWRRKHRAREYGDDPAFLRSISPIHKADQIRCPLLVVQGDRDVRVPPWESKQIVETVQGNGGVVEHVVYPEEGHGIQKLDHRLDMGERVVAFAREHLLGRR